MLRGKWNSEGTLARLSLFFQGTSPLSYALSCETAPRWLTVR